MGASIRMAIMGVEKRQFGRDDGFSTMSIEDEIYKNEQKLPSVELSLEHLRLRCGGVAMAAQGEVGVEEAKRWLKKAPHKDVVALGSWTDPPPCVLEVVQAALTYLCDSDTSWENCVCSLRQGRGFTREVIEFQHLRITRKNLEKMMACSLDMHRVLTQAPKRDGLYTAVSLCLLMECIILENKVRLGIPAPPPPPPVEFTPEQPRIVQFRQLLPALEGAQELQRTPLLVCNGKEDIICTFFSYMCAVAIDAKELINEVLVKKTISLEDMRDKVRQKAVKALKYGRPLHIRLSTASPDWSGYCCEGGLPLEVFAAAKWKTQEVWSQVVRPQELDGACFNFDSHFVFVTSDLDLPRVQQHLKGRLPYYDALAIIDIAPDSIH
eukprot:CAMPEP_0176147614 /NCGR_PEP_ID=MMETSP0120_2-20121206/75253_1 /TAXON_ID=160619 /ORGANISM="Kryptoperidinium foliaceum, Strain CCMP 1326" /LENGTH=380 /DNA_ID=CAMNT_0017484239 /DNA_START=65 /DNA_END=1207 /DNA_ORIENTATION=+